MKNQAIILIGIFLPFLGTSIGSAVVLFFRNEISTRLNKIFLGFSGGVMMAASIWSLILPSIEMSENYGILKCVPPTIGLVLGLSFIPIIDKFIDYEKLNYKTNKNVLMLATSITLHNIPEGMAVGVAFANCLNGNFDNLIIGAIILAIGIAIQNFPEGASISLPLKSSGLSNGKACMWGILSGIVEPIATIFTIFLSAIISPLLVYFLSFAAGCMIYVVIKELVPVSVKEDNVGVFSFASGFILMMILDVMLG